MAPEEITSERDASLRSMLVERADRRAGATRSSRTGARSDGLRVGIVTAVVLTMVVALAVVALRFAGDRGAPAPAQSGLPTMSAPAGVLLGRWTSADGPKQSHMIHPNGLAIATAFACEGPGSHMVHIPHSGDEGGDGACGNSSSSSNKGTAGSVRVTITTSKAMRWTLTVVGIPETYVTPRPVTSPTASTGDPVRFCTAADLQAHYQPVAGPNDPTAASGGQLVFTDTSTSACALAGYPMVRFVDDDGTTLGHHTMNAIDTRSSTEKGLFPVVLRPGGKAYSQIGFYQPSFYPENEEGTCVQRPVHALRIDLANRLAGAAQTGTLQVPTKRIIACMNGAHGVDGKYGQLSSTVFVDYSKKQGE